MTLTDDDLRQCLFAVIEQRDALHRGKFLGPAPRPDELIRKLFAELSQPRQSEDSQLSGLNHDDKRLGAREVSQMIGWHVRRVQRHYKKLGGEIVRGRIEFRDSAIREHLEGTRP